MANIIGGSIGAGKAILNDYTLGVEDIDGGHRLTITRGSEVQTMDVLDGKNGADGKDGAPGADGRDGIDGKDGAPGAVQTVNGEAPDENGNVQVSGLPEGASENQQLVTDSEGVVKWEGKPFYSVQYGEDITWDGDTTGMETFEFQGGVFYKVSDTIYTLDKMVGRKYAVMNGGTAISNVVTADMIITLPECPDLHFVMYNDLPVFCFGPACESLSFPGGVFFLNFDGSFYTNYLSGRIVKKIDPFYIPLIPAENLPSSLFTIVQKTYEGSFDKVTEGRDTFVFNAYNYYKISEFALKREDVISFSGTRANGRPLSDITEGENCCGYGHFIVVYQAGKCNLVVAGTTTSYSFNAPSAGLYAKCESGNDYQTAGTYNYTYRAVRHMIQSSTTFKRYYLDVDDSGALIATEVTE